MQVGFLSVLNSNSSQPLQSPSIYREETNQRRSKAEEYSSRRAEDDKNNSSLDVILNSGYKSILFTPSENILNERHFIVFFILLI